MARFQKTIGDILAGHASMSRDVGTQALAVPELAGIGLENLNEELQTNIDVVNADMVVVQETLVAIDDAQANAMSDLIQLSNDLTGLDTDLTELDAQMVALQADLAANDAAQAQLDLDLAALDAAQVLLRADLAANEAAQAALDGELTALDTQLAENSALVSNTMTGLRTDLTALDTELNTIPGQITTAVNAAQAIPLTNERFNPASLTIWPFVNKAVPANAFALNAITGPDLANFAVSANKLSIKRHVLF